MSLVNKYNFLRWDDDGSPLTSCEDNYILPVVAADVLKFYINFDSPISDDTSTWKLGIWLSDVGIAIRDIATMTEVDIDGTNHDIYVEYTLNALPGPWFRLVIYDGSDNIKYWSNALRYYAVEPDNTYVVKYRNSFNRVNFNYEDITAFYNQFRINGRVADRVPQREVTGYTISSGHWIQAKDIHRAIETVQTYFLDKYTHEAMMAAVSCDEFYIDTVRYYAGENEYSGTPQGESQRWNAEIKMYLYDYTVVASNT